MSDPLNRPVRLAPPDPTPTKVLILSGLAAIVLFTPIEEMTLAAILWKLSTPKKKR